MVEETIQTIKETEREAEEIIKDADARCAGILEEASKKAAKIKEDAVRDVVSKRSWDTNDAGCIEGNGRANCIFKGDSASQGGCGCICGDRKTRLTYFRLNEKPEKMQKEGGMRLWQFCRCKESVSAR